MKTQIELLSPARNLECGKAAIQHGADAVYIGASGFSARADASNSVADIEKLVRFAHLYRAKVYAAFNTILYDKEIDNAVQLIYKLYEAGIDAIIIQDMGLLRCNLPPVPLFASTQTHNTTPEKISFLEKVGFSRVILARELSLSQIEAISKQTNVELECFVHGALCVSYSGQCYMSQAITGRSGNRGVCAQPCRSSYRLLDVKRNTIIENAHLLSLKDLSLSDYLEQLINVGITSFKIEGRLKDLSYVKNITAYYRRQIDAIIEKPHPQSLSKGEGRVRWAKASSGNIDLFFIPNPFKTFNRGYTTYFIEGRKEKVASPHTPKSIGERIGKVLLSTPQWFTICEGGIANSAQQRVNNGDGLCWLQPQKGFEGALVNKGEGNKIFTAKPVNLKQGMSIFRNNDFMFEKEMSSNSSDRRIDVSLELSEHESGYTLFVEDEDGNKASYSVDIQKTVAKDTTNAQKQIDTQLRKLGNTAFSAKKVVLFTPLLWRGEGGEVKYFIPTSILNDMRRQVIQRLEEVRLERYQAKPFQRISTEVIYPATNLDYRGNVANRHAKEFYRQHGVKHIDDAFELQANYNGKTLMTTKYCIKYHYNIRCNPEPMYLKDNRFTYLLKFDCKRCEMNVILENKKP